MSERKMHKSFHATYVSLAFKYMGKNIMFNVQINSGINLWTRGKLG